MEPIDEGNNGRVYSSTFGIIKVQKRKSLGHNILTQKKIHSLTEQLIGELKLQTLCVPKLHHENLSQYEMEFVNTEKIIYLGDLSHSTTISEKLYEQILTEFTTLWIALFSKGYAAWDCELFLQPNGKVMLLDFDKYGIVSKKDNTIVMPHWKSEQHFTQLKTFFQNSCFSPDFVSRLFSKGFAPPPCLITL